jgi:hypothetical protein
MTETEQTTSNQLNNGLMNATQALPQLPAGISITAERTAKASAPAAPPLKLHQYVQAELRRSRRYSTVAFVALAVAGAVAVALAFAWPFLSRM